VLAAQPVPNFPRLRALALFGRRPAQHAERLVVAGVQKPAQNRTFVAGFLAITSNARRTLQRPLSCLAPQAPAFSLDGFRGIADMIVGLPATQPPEWLVAFWPIAFFERMPSSWCGQSSLAVGAILWDELPH